MILLIIFAIHQCRQKRKRQNLVIHPVIQENQIENDLLNVNNGNQIPLTNQDIDIVQNKIINKVCETEGIDKSELSSDHSHCLECKS